MTTTELRLFAALDRLLDAVTDMRLHDSEIHNAASLLRELRPQAEGTKLSEVIKNGGNFVGKSAIENLRNRR